MGRNLSKGMTGEDVRVLQKLLNHHLSPPLKKLTEDGAFGNATHDRVVEFQRRNRNYPSTMPIPRNMDLSFRKPLKDDGIVGPLTSNVLWDTRTLKTSYGRLTPVSESRGAAAPGGGSRLSLTGDGPVGQAAGGGTPTPPPAKTFRIVQLSVGQQAAVNPWTFSPIVFTGQYTLLAKNDGRPDFLLTAGGQVSMNDGGANGRWSGQIFGQMGLGGFDQLKLGKLDWFNPFVAAMFNANFANNLGVQQTSIGLAIGNQATWTILRRPLPGTNDMQDTLSLFLNAQAVANVDLHKGECAAPSGQFLLGLVKTFF